MRLFINLRLHLLLYVHIFIRIYVCGCVSGRVWADTVCVGHCECESLDWSIPLLPVPEEEEIKRRWRRQERHPAIRRQSANTLLAIRSHNPEDGLISRTERQLMHTNRPSSVPDIARCRPLLQVDGYTKLLCCAKPLFVAADPGGFNGVKTPPFDSPEVRRFWILYSNSTDSPLSILSSLFKVQNIDSVMGSEWISLR